MNDLRTLRCSAWLGWQIESNWASPVLFVLYVLVKPLAGSLLLVCMYWAAREATGTTAPGFLPFLYVSSACFMLIGGVAHGMSQAVIADRENYGMLKFIRISPVRLRTYLIGRGLAKAGQAAVGALLTLTIGLILFSELREAMGGAEGVAWGWLAVNLLTGTVMLVALGVILASAVLNMSRYGMFLSEGVAGVLFLLSGAVFPIDVLPPWLQLPSLLLPPTYWLEAMRRCLLGSGSLASPLSRWGLGELSLILAGGTLVLSIIALWFFRWSERRAWRLGRYDENSGN